MAETAELESLRAQIQATRERMGDTVEQLGERLNPSRLKEQVKHDIREATIGKVEHMAHNAADRVNGAGRTMIQTIRDNPIPAAMIGVGLGWFLFNSKRGSSTVVSEKAGAVAGVVKDTAGDVADQAKAAMSQVADRAQDVAGAVADQTRTQARRLGNQMHDSPLAIGVAALSLGLVAGLAIPETQKENDLFGGTRDQAVDKVREVADETRTKVQHVAERVVSEAKNTATAAAREEGLIEGSSTAAGV